MIRSMTGFGKAAGDLAGDAVSVEITSVNHRFFDCSLRLPGPWSALEIALREQLKQRLERGKVNVFVNRRRGAADRTQLHLDKAVAHRYYELSRALAQSINSTQALSLDTYAKLEGVFYFEEGEEDLEDVRAVVEPLVADAAEQVAGMRAQEGAALEADLRERLAAMREAAARVDAERGSIQQQYEARLRERIAALNVDANVAEDRLAIEVALLADKSDVSEELVRLRAHFAHFEEHLQQDAPVGRELNFLAQEIQREANTLGSKLREAGVTREVLRIKTELEKLREQAQNIE